MQVAVGIQNKLLEAMAMGLPVVATPISTRPLGENCPGVIKAGDYSGMIAEISRLFDDPASARDIGEQGRREVIRNFSWKSSVGKLEQIYEEATKDFQR
jgi:glycosyltransferase involved in cell wall biosynthesis